MDVNILNTVYKMLKNTSITDFEMKKGETHIHLKLDPSASPVLAPDIVPETESAPAQEPVPLTICSDTVGVFYDHKLPLKKGLVHPGDEVKKGQVVGVIMSMGISHDLRSEVSGRITARKISNKEPVEYGEIIYEVERV